MCSQNKSSNESKRTRLCLLLPSDLLFWKLLNFTTCFVQICEGYNIDRTMEVDMDKRAYSDPEDPRNLFAAMYGGVYKREDPYDFRCGIYYYLHIYRYYHPDLHYSGLSPDQMQYLKSFMEKRGRRRSSFRGWSGLKDPYDPR